jgi:P-loop Domain of unknown function (DUF2791)
MNSDRDAIPLEHWIATIDNDYMKTYLSEGGAAVKVVVAQDDYISVISDAIRVKSSENGFTYCHVDSRSQKLHLVAGLFNEIARQIDWDEVARSFIRGLIKKSNRNIPPNGDISLASIAITNDEAEHFIIQDIRKLLTKYVFREYDLSREFRIAAMNLCMAAISREEDVLHEAEQIKKWLMGTIESVGPLKRIGIYKKINRGNARQLLFSTVAWLRKAGLGGLIVTMDFSRYYQGKMGLGDGFTYTKSAAMDMNEVLRQFIDSTDEVTSAMFVFIAGPKFLSENTGLNGYEALRLRLTDDVKDRNRPNLFAPMIRIK